MRPFRLLADPDTAWGRTLVAQLKQALPGPTVADYGSQSGAVTIDPGAADLTTVTLAGNVTLTLRPGTAGAVAWLELAQDATGARTVTLSGGTAPGWTMTATASRRDMLALVYSGSQWVAGIHAQNYTG